MLTIPLGGIYTPPAGHPLGAPGRRMRSAGVLETTLLKTPGPSIATKESDPKRSDRVASPQRDRAILSRSTPGAIIHRNVAVIACDTSATLQETVHRLQDLEVDAIAVGDRHLVLPATDIGRVLDRLKEHGQFPRLVGELEVPDSIATEAGEQEDGE